MQTHEDLKTPSWSYNYPYSLGLHSYWLDLGLRRLKVGPNDDTSAASVNVYTIDYYTVIYSNYLANPYALLYLLRIRNSYMGIFGLLIPNMVIHTTYHSLALPKL